EDARFVRTAGKAQKNVLWGCDMEEGQPEALLRELSALNPGHAALAEMVEKTREGYRRSAAPKLFELAEALGQVSDRTMGGVSLRDSVVATLDVERDRASPDTRLSASIKREALMKRLFLLHFESDCGGDPAPKVMARFGRNHLHRGIDGRGVSTL